jgi:hypothetical protein
MLDLRRLRLHGLIERVPKTHRYRVTDIGLRTSVFFTRTYARLFRATLGQIAPRAPAAPGKLQAHFNRLDAAIADTVEKVRLAA